MTEPIKLSLKSLEGLPQEELLRIANQAMEVKRALKARKLDHYLESAHVGQLEGHKDTHRILYVVAPNRMGKSTFGAAELIWNVLGTHPFKRCKVPIRSAVVCPDFENHAKNVFEPKLNEWAPEGAIKKIDRHQGGAIKKIIWASGSTTDVFSFDQDPMAFEGSDFDLVWFDEPPPYKIWTALWRSVTDRGGRMYMTGTPLTSPWLFKEYQRTKDGADPIVKWIRFAKNSNAKNLGQGDEELGLKRIAELASQYDEEERAGRVDGDFIQLQGLIFKSYSGATHKIAPFAIPHSWPIIESIDPHPQKPWAVSWIAISPVGIRFLLQSAYFEGGIDDTANGIIVYREKLDIEGGLRPNITRCLIDNMASVPTWSKSFTDPTARRISVREELENLIGPRGAGGPPIHVCPKNVQGKIDIFKRWLRLRDVRGVHRPGFYAFDGIDNEGFFNEIESYAWARFSKRARSGELKGQPNKVNDDILDTIMQIALTYETQSAEAEVVDMTGGFTGYGRPFGGIHGRAADYD